MPTLDHDALMRLAIQEAERARGSTGDNPWVGGVIVDAAGAVLGRGYTRGPGEDHAEIGAFREADASGREVTGATLYSTLEPCSFHGRTPACSRVIIERRVARVVIAMNDPNPKVDGEGVRILQRAGIEVIEHVRERDVRRQLGGWVFKYHPHEPVRWVRSLGARPPADIVERLVDRYDVDRAQAQAVAAAAAGDGRAG
jgi:diaminohydroxyphosphoribosylaminopyrimidine deaminase/5-amino-6-(5-phosphoribosylamino)uracil reductase